MSQQSYLRHHGSSRVHERMVLFEAEGYRPLTIAKMLESEGVFISRQGVAKFLLRVKAAGSNTIIEVAYNNYSATYVKLYSTYISIVHIYSIVCV